MISIHIYYMISVDDTISVYVDYERGKNLADILDVNGEVLMTISVGRVTTSPTTAATNGQFTANNTSVLFVSISFIVLIIISLAWLVFYYIQRCRYTNAKERLSVSTVELHKLSRFMRKLDFWHMRKQRRRSASR